MQTEPRRNRFARSLFVVAAFVVVVAGMRAINSILVPVLFSVLLALIAATPVKWLVDKRVPRVLAVAVVVLALLGIGVTVGTLVGSSLIDFTVSLPFYQTRLEAELAGVISWIEQRAGLDVRNELVERVLDPGQILQIIGVLLSGLGGLLGNVALVVLTMVFMLLEASDLPVKLRAATGDPGPTLVQWHRVAENVNRYLALKTLISLVTGVGVTILLIGVGVDYPFLWGILAFLLNYIPNIGSLIAAVPAVLLAFVQFGMGRALVTAAGYLMINMVMGNLIEPRVLGRGVGLSTLVVFLSLVFWGWVLGPAGLLLSVPLTMIVKISLENNSETRWIAIMLGSRSDAESVVYSD